MQTARMEGQPGNNRPPPHLSYEVGVAQWQGTRDRQNDVVWVTEPSSRQGMVMALADGIGTGQEAGDAAEAAVDAMNSAYAAGPPDEEPCRLLLRMLGQAHQRVRSLNGAQRQRGAPAAGAALAGVLIRDGMASVASVGNVRVLLYRSGMLLQLNRDNLLSLAEEERGILSGAEPDLRPEWGMTVTAYAGMEGLGTVDYMQTPLHLLSSDRIVLMSSGLYGVFPENELCRILSDPRAQSAADRLIARLRGCGGKDQSNASIAIVKVNRHRRAQKYMVSP